MEKKFKHSKEEKCILCEKQINTTKDNWAVIIDYIGDKQDKAGFYHQKCLKDLLKGNVEVISNKFKDKLREFTQGMLKGMKEPNPQLEVNLKRLAS